MQLIRAFTHKGGKYAILSGFKKRIKIYLSVIYTIYPHYTSTEQIEENRGFRPPAAENFPSPEKNRQRGEEFFGNPNF